MPQLNPYQEIIAPWNEKSALHPTKEYQIAIDYCLEDGGPSLTTYFRVEALDLEDAKEKALEELNDNFDAYDVLDIREYSAY